MENSQPSNYPILEEVNNWVAHRTVPAFHTKPCFAHSIVRALTLFSLGRSLMVQEKEGRHAAVASEPV